MPQNKPLIEKFPALMDGRHIQYYNVKIPQNAYDEKHYQCIIDNVFRKESLTPLSEVRSETDFSVSKTEYNNKFQAKFNIHSTDVSDTNQEALTLLDLHQLFTIPTKEIACLLNKNGKMTKILNGESIYKKWKDTFNTFKQKIKDKNIMMKVSDIGEKEFSNPLSGIEKRQLYSLFFFPLFNTQFTYNTHPSFDLMEASHLLNGQITPIYLKKKHLEIDNSNIVIQFEGSSYNNQALYSESKKIFGNFLPPNTEYEGDMSVEYCINAEYGYPVYVKSRLKESLVGVFDFEQSLEIREINDYSLKNQMEIADDDKSREARKNAPPPPEQKEYKYIGGHRLVDPD